MIRLEKIQLKVGTFSLKDIDLQVEPGEYFIVVGPTGAGKTVLLETIAGFFRPDSGKIWLKDRDATRLDPESRGLSVVYQSSALFPHLSVKENILFSLRIKHETSAETARALAWVTDLLGISLLVDRKPVTLSGGEKQKVALARALVCKPDILLLDEPLSGLDPVTKEALQLEIQKLHSVAKFTAIHITHDFEEALIMGNRLAVMKDGRVQQVGEPHEVFHHPNSEFVAFFTKSRNVFSGRTYRNPSGSVNFKTGGLDFQTAADRTEFQHASIRPEDITVSDRPINCANCWPGTVRTVADRGIYVTVSVEVENMILECILAPAHFADLNVHIGDTIYIGIQPRSINSF